jgi:hypothetical protein
VYIGLSFLTKVLLTWTTGPLYFIAVLEVLPRCWRRLRGAPPAPVRPIPGLPVPGPESPPESAPDSAPESAPDSPPDSAAGPRTAPEPAGRS